eukprot:7850094-Pyramimonas_sp.AAC.1
MAHGARGWRVKSHSLKAVKRRRASDQSINFCQQLDHVRALSKNATRKGDAKKNPPRRFRRTCAKADSTSPTQVFALMEDKHCKARGTSDDEGAGTARLSTAMSK